MTDDYIAGLWNAIDSLLSFWERALTDSLQDNAPPDDRFWQRLSEDLDTARGLVLKARSA